MRADPVIIGIDLGTTVCKSLVFDQKLRLLAGAAKDLPLITLSGTEIEQDAELWWEASKQVLHDSVREAGIDPRRVKGIGISAQGISFVPVDRSCNPLRSAFSWLDTRAKRQRRQILKRIDEKTIFSITGKRCHDSYVLPKLLWFREMEPKVYEKSHKILMPLDFLIARLTGELLTDHTMAGGTMFYDINAQAWSAQILEEFDLDPGKLPEIRWGGTPAGRLSKHAAEELGLTGDVVVAVGGQDQKVAALGAGIDLDRTTVSLGTAMAISQKCSTPVFDPRLRIPCFTDLLPGCWVIEGSAVCCSILDWMKQTLFPDKSYAELDRLAELEDGRANPVMLFPFFSGAGSPHSAPDSRGFLYGLELSSRAGQLVRSVLEGIAFQIKENLDVMEEISKPAQELRIFGGGAKSAVWCRIIADATEKPVAALGITEAASTGAAILAGMGAGIFGEAQEAFPYIKVRQVFAPGKESAPMYREQHQRYQEIQRKVLGL